MVTYVSLSLPYDQLQFAYIAHNVLQSVLGFLLSIPLRQAFKATWNWAATTRVTIAIALILVVATVWANAATTAYCDRRRSGPLGRLWWVLIPVFICVLGMGGAVPPWLSMRNYCKANASLRWCLRQADGKRSFKLVSAESAAREAQLNYSVIS